MALASASSCNLDDCDRSGCEYTDGPVSHPGISAGIAGGASSASDVVENGCAECPFASGEIRVWSAPNPVETAAAAKAVYEAGAEPLEDIQFDGPYERALTPGEYLACLPEDEDVTCAGMTVPNDGVVTFHILYLYGPTSIAVYPAGQDTPSDERLFTWTIVE